MAAMVSSSSSSYSSPVSSEFRDPGELVDGDLNLVIRELAPAQAEIGWAPAYRFDLTTGGVVVGHIDLRLGASDFMVRFAGQVGYGVDPPYRGRRYAARALRLIAPLAHEHGLVPLWITCNPENWASRLTCERAGAKLIEIVNLPRDCDMYSHGDRRKCRYQLSPPR